MHIPDGFLDTKTWLSFWVVSFGSIGFALKKIKNQLEEKSIPLMGVLGAFVFAAQMLNFPVLNGTSGHFVGGVLLGIILGPYAGFIVMTVILLLQSLLFADGGILTLGANIFNMGLIGTIFGYYIYSFLNKTLKGKFFIASFFSAWLSIVIGALFCSIQLSISGTIPLSLGVPSMVGIHALIGIGEGLITSLILSFVFKVRKDIVFQNNI